MRTVSRRAARTLWPGGGITIATIRNEPPTALIRSTLPKGRNAAAGSKRSRGEALAIASFTSSVKNAS
jgi:hypothetical protein